MSYPTRLLPQPHYHPVRDDAALKTQHLMRFRTLPLYRPTDNSTIREVDPTAVVEPRKNVDDVSTHHYGHSLEEDLRLKMTGSRKDWWHADWPEGEAVGIPIASEDFDLVHDRHPIYWPIDRLHGTLVPVQGEQGDDRSIRCQVKHTPKRWNFWHFSIGWQDMAGTPLHRNHPAFGRLVQTASRKLLCASVLENAPPPQLLPVEMYSYGIA